LREFLDYINDIYQETLNIEKFLKNVDYEDFILNLEKFYAVTRCLEIIGEAAKKIPENITAKYPDIPWSILAKMRDKLIHYYYNADEEIIWNTAKKDIIVLKDDLKYLLNDFK
jgi:uncharacterized protein with HEPN domain